MLLSCLPRLPPPLRFQALTHQLTRHLAAYWSAACRHPYPSPTCLGGGMAPAHLLRLPRPCPRAPAPRVAPAPKSASSPQSSPAAPQSRFLGRWGAAPGGAIDVSVSMPSGVTLAESRASSLLEAPDAGVSIRAMRCRHSDPVVRLPSVANWMRNSSGTPGPWVPSLERRFAVGLLPPDRFAVGFPSRSGASARGDSEAPPWPRLNEPSRDAGSAVRARAGDESREDAGVLSHELAWELGCDVGREPGCDGSGEAQ